MSTHGQIQQWQFRYYTTSGQQVSLKKLTQPAYLATHYMPDGTLCLSKVLTVQLAMKRYRHQPTPCFSLAKAQSDALAADARIELEDCVIIENISDLERYQPLSTLLEIVA